MKTAKDLELLLLIKEHEKQKLQLRINQALEILENRINFDKEQIGYILEVERILKGKDYDKMMVKDDE